MLGSDFMPFNILLTGDLAKLETKLQQKSQADFTEVQKKSLRDIYTRGVKQYYRGGLVPESGGTPVDKGELRISLGYTGDEVGYTKDYGPHVEFGHRTKNGGWVPGQFFLKKNVDTQREIYKQDLINKIKE
jgi:hypothetical protein